jgi:hypothetical protein
MSEREIDYVEGPGPGIPELPAGPIVEPIDDAEQAAPEQLPGWEVETVEQFLRGAGAGLHMLAGVAERDWMMTQADLERIAAPLTRIANRYEPVLRLSPMADPLLVAHGFALYGWRSALERKRALRDLQDELAAGDGYEPVDSAPPAESAASSAEDLRSESYFPQSPKAPQGGETSV